jgi:hypothetical protein
MSIASGIEVDPSSSEKVIADTIRFRCMEFDGFHMAWDTAAMAAICQMPESASMGPEVIGYASKIAGIAIKLSKAGVAVDYQVRPAKDN